LRGRVVLHHTKRGRGRSCEVGGRRKRLSTEERGQHGNCFIAYPPAGLKGGEEKKGTTLTRSKKKGGLPAKHQGEKGSCENRKKKREET